VRFVTEEQNTNTKMLRIMRFAVDNAAYAAFIVKSDARFIYANKTASRMLGYSNEELLGMAVYDIDPEFPREAWSEHWRMLNEYKAITLSSSFQTKDGGVFPVEVSINLLEFEGEKYDVAFVRDISVHEHALEKLEKDASELREAEASAFNMMEEAHEARRKAERIAEELTKQIEARKRTERQLLVAQKMEAVGRLAGGVAHDFNNLLTVILSSAELLGNRLREDDPARSELQEIERSARHATALTRQLLAFSRGQTLAPRTLDLNGIVHGLHPMLRRLAPESISIVEHTTREACHANVDAGQLEQAIVNLVTNACDAMTDGGTITIETLTRAVSRERTDRIDESLDIEPGVFATISVTDTGAGMDEETVAHIFEPFYTTKPEGEGTGLGLSTTYGIIRQHHGFLSVYSEVAKGSSFVIHLPLTKGDGEPHEEPERETAAKPGNETILVVEDNRDVRATVARMLRELGYTVFEATGGPGALKLFAERSGGDIHVLVTDLTMPEMDGSELARKLRDLSPEIKIVYISGYPCGHLDSAGLIEEGAAILRKPFSKTAIGSAVRNLLDA